MIDDEELQMDYNMQCITGQPFLADQVSPSSYFSDISKMFVGIDHVQSLGAWAAARAKKRGGKGKKDCREKGNSKWDLNG